jgi:hypothetical protein
MSVPKKNETAFGAADFALRQKRLILAEERPEWPRPSTARRAGWCMEQMAAPYEQGHAFGGVIDVLEAVGAVYAIWGGLAVVAYGEPRFTQDMDVLLRGDSLLVFARFASLRDESSRRTWRSWREVSFMTNDQGPTNTAE